MHIHTKIFSYSGNTQNASLLRQVPNVVGGEAVWVRHNTLLHKKTALILILVIFIAFVQVLILNISVQLLYPRNISRPFTQVGNTALPMMNSARISKTLSQSKYSIIILPSDGEPLTVLSNAAGLNVDEVRTSAWATYYPLSERLVPFSIFRSRELAAPDYKVDERALSQFSTKVSQILEIKPQNASIGIENQQVIIQHEMVGQQVNETMLKSSIISAVNAHENTVKVAVTEAKPAVGSESLLGAKAKAELLMSRNITLQLGSYSKVIGKDQIADWIIFIPAADGLGSDVVLDTQAIGNFLGTMRQYADVSPRPSRISVVDGESRIVEEGTQGLTLQLNETAQMIASAISISTSPTVVKAKIVPVSPKKEYTREYTQTSQGLNVFIQDLLKARRYKVAMSFNMLNGEGWSAGFNETELMVTASVYKIFIAQIMFENINAGFYTWDSQVSTGQTVNYCFERMIVFSDERCTIAIAQLFGWSNIDNRLHELGYTSTHLNNYGPRPEKLTTARDMNLFLQRLYEGSVGTKEQKELLLDAMRRQIYRKGIPAGVNGVTVADKVGYYNGNVNDAGIVYGKDKTYALAILTNGGNWADIAKITSEIDRFIGNQ